MGQLDETYVEQRMHILYFNIWSFLVYVRPVRIINLQSRTVEVSVMTPADHDPADHYVSREVML